MIAAGGKSRSRQTHQTSQGDKLMAIGLSHGGKTIYSGSSRPDEVWVGTREGLVVLERTSQGTSWQVGRRMLTDKHISAILMEAQSGLTFVGAFHGSLHVTADGGRTFEPRNAGLSEQDVYSIAAVQRGERIHLYVGTEPAHIFFSDDLGTHWMELPALRSVPSVPRWKFPAPPHLAHTKVIAFDPYDADTVYACIEVGGLLKSKDGGDTWRELEGLYEDVHRIVIHPQDPKRLYVVTGRGLYVSQDAGATFEQWISRPSPVGNYPDALVLHPRHPELIFLGAAEHGPGRWRETHFAGARISRSKDGGRTWEVLCNGLPDRLQASIEAMCLDDWGDSVSVFAATTAGEVYCSDDAGEHWSRIISGLAPISKGGHYENLAVA
jgi:photosystem II stability/assembly factor-like uncharacterized protein